jgi:disulfide bond formation protein DsbB
MGEWFMDNYELKPERKKINWKSLVWNFLTVIVLLGTCCLAYYFLTIFNNPNSPLNPFPPASLPTLYQTATPTSTPILLPSTWTPTTTIQPSPSRTKAPTWTLLPQMITPFTSTVTPTKTTPTITSTPMPASAEITYVASTDFHPDENCNWLGVAGKVLGTDGKPLLSQQIQLGGTLDSVAINFTTLSGLAPAYGQSGFEMVLSDHPTASTQALWIQLLDTTSKPLTNRIYFDTYDGCTQNLVMVIFTKNR